MILSLATLILIALCILMLIIERLRDLWVSVVSKLT